MTTRRKQNLALVKPGATPPEPIKKPKPLPLDKAIETGDYYQILLSQRSSIAESIPGEKGPAKAALHRQLALISKEIDAIEARKTQEAAEDIDGGRISDEAWDEDAI